MKNDIKLPNSGADDFNFDGSIKQPYNPPKEEAKKEQSSNPWDNDPAYKNRDGFQYEKFGITNEQIWNIMHPNGYDNLPDWLKTLIDNNPYFIELKNFSFNQWKPNASYKELQQILANMQSYVNDLLAKHQDVINSSPQTDVSNKIAAGYNPAFLDSSNAPSPAQMGGVSDYSPTVNPSEQAEPLDILGKVFNTAMDVGNFALSVFGGINQYRSTQSALSLSASLERAQELDNFIKGQNVWELFGSVVGGYTDDDLKEKFPLLSKYGFGQSSPSSRAANVRGKADFGAENIRDYFLEASRNAYIPTLQDETGSYYVDNEFFETYAAALRDLRAFSVENETLSTRFSSDYLNVARSLGLGQETARYDSEFISSLDPKTLAEAKNAVAELQAKQTKWAKDLHGKTWNHAIDLIENGNMAQKSWGLYLIEKLIGGQSPISDVGSGLSDIAKLLISKKL